MDKFIRVGEDRFQRIRIRRDVGDDHVEREQERDEPRAQPGHQKPAAETLQEGDKPSIHARQRDVQALKKIRDVRDAVQLAPAGLEK